MYKKQGAADAVDKICFVFFLIGLDNPGEILYNESGGDVMPFDFIDKLAESRSTTFGNINLPAENDPLPVWRVGLHTLVQLNLNPNLNFHSHAFWELHVSLRGYAVYCLEDGQILRVEEGTWLLIPAGCVHRIVEYSSEYIKFSSSFSLPNETVHDPAYRTVSKQLLQAGVRVGQVTERQMLDIERIWQLRAELHSLTVLMIRNCADNILLSVADSLRERDEQNNSYGSGVNDISRYLIAVQFVQDNLYRPIRSADVAKSVYMSTKQLNRIFAREMGMSISDYISEQKCYEAKRLLAEGTEPIHVISARLGFGDQFYFNKFFKKHVGLPPHRYRKANAEKK